ncbi:adenosylcobinamide-phosphate synthase CbiB [Methanorbis rubei]|uniref:Probable cobalamin biosynthesis protein CobD n=1 Tax=Methanorbis rubei TaxID=3028300 RepID=A0AAE4MFH3_9EURY|nr:Cobalamin biosynthesis protein CobD [Methanocorpusculaceae archaeon Cs1]
MAFGAITLFFALILDRLIGDPHSRFHPVALLGSLIGLWGRTNYYPKKLERFVGILGWLLTVAAFTLPFLLVSWPSEWWYIQLPIAVVLLSFCFAWRSLEEHVAAVETALAKGDAEGRAAVQLLVSRDTAKLSHEHIRSAAYESAAENLVDSIVAPLFWFAVFELLFGMGIVGAALFRAANTMDAMLGYKDDRIRIGWFAARMDDVLAYIPARIAGGLLVILFACRGRFRQAVTAYRADHKKRPGFNGGIPMSLIAGGCGIMFDKPGVYTIGSPERTLDEGGGCIIRIMREVTILFAGIIITVLLVWG